MLERSASERTYLSSRDIAINSWYFENKTIYVDVHSNKGIRFSIPSIRYCGKVTSSNRLSRFTASPYRSYDGELHNHIYVHNVGHKASAWKGAVADLGLTQQWVDVSSALVSMRWNTNFNLIKRKSLLSAPQFDSASWSFTIFVVL